MSGWIANHFFHPGIVVPLGIALVALPIIIHFINRLRYRTVQFAAMEFLLQSQNKNRNRVLIEQLLLLLLRILIVLFLLALIARFILDPQQLALFRGQKTHHVVLIDDSASMREKWGETTAFDEALEVVRRLVAEGSRRPGTQKLSLILLSNPQGNVLLPEQDIDQELLQDLDAELSSLECSYRALDLATGLNACRKRLEQEKATVRHLHVISDYRKNDWEGQTAVGEAIQALEQQNIAVNLVKTVATFQGNLAVTRLAGDLQIAAPGIPVRFRTEIKNYSDQLANNVALSLFADGKKLPLSVNIEEIKANASIEREFDITFETPGFHDLQVALPPDVLECDNTNHLSFDLSANHPVLIVDGDLASDEGLYIADALGDVSTTGYVPELQGVDFLKRNPLTDYQCLFMVNVSELSDETIASLEEYVRNGGGLVWYLGDTIQPSFYNQNLYKPSSKQNEGEATPSGVGLFPVPLASARSQLPDPDPTNPGSDLTLSAHPIFEIFQDFNGERNPFVDLVRVQSWFPVAEDWIADDNERQDGVVTIAKLRNEHPLMFEHRFGRGKVLTFLSSCGPSWNNWANGPGSPCFAVVQLEMTKQVARAENEPDRRYVGQPIQVSLDPTEFTDQVEIVSGDDRVELKAVLESTTSPAGEKNDDPAGSQKTEQHWKATLSETKQPGVYRVISYSQNQQQVESRIAYNVDNQESDLLLATRNQILAAAGAGTGIQIQEPGSLDWLESQEAGQEIRMLILILLVLFLVAEQFLAHRLSYHPESQIASRPTAVRPAARRAKQQSTL